MTISRQDPHRGRLKSQKNALGSCFLAVDERRLWPPDAPILHPTAAGQSGQLLPDSRAIHTSYRTPCATGLAWGAFYRVTAPGDMDEMGDKSSFASRWRHPFISTRHREDLQ